jgi:hypothetical protein
MKADPEIEQHATEIEGEENHHRNEDENVP